MKIQTRTTFAEKTRHCDIGYKLNHRYRRLEEDDQKTGRLEEEDKEEEEDWNKTQTESDTREGAYTQDSYTG